MRRRDWILPWLLLCLASCGGPQIVPESSTETGDAASGTADEQPSADESGNDGDVVDVVEVDGDGDDAPEPPIVRTSCDDAGVCSGTLDPTLLGPGIERVPTGRNGTGAAGLHWFCRPAAGWNGRVVIHLVGTWSDPAVDHRFPEHACALGFAAVAPMYENRQPARETCGDDGACYEAHRREIVDGEDGAPLPVDVDGANSIRGRTTTLLARLADGDSDDVDGVWATVRDRLAAGDFGAVVLSGHSQGSGHALYLARHEAAERLVLLAGPSDRLGDRTAAHAAVPWIDALRTAPTRTATSRIFGYLHEDDTIQVVDQVVDNWRAIGIDDATCPYVAAGGYAPACRRILIPSADCPGLQAHTTVVARRWGPRCALGTGDNTNQATWEHFLLSSDRDDAASR